MLIREQINYDPETGIFVWSTSGPKRKRGERAGSTDPRGYRRITINGKYYLEHRLAWFLSNREWPRKIDHINGDKTDNRLANLRPATTSENGRNRPAQRNGGSKFKGVGFHSQKGRWRARIFADGKELHLGLFDDEIAAAKAYDEAASKLFGSFAYLNFKGEN